MALIAAHLNAGHSGGDSVAIGMYSPSSPPQYPFPPFSPSLISLMVSVDVKHHVYLLTYLRINSFLFPKSIDLPCFPFRAAVYIRPKSLFAARLKLCRN